MDIYDILSSKPHNPHYLSRYIKFIENCQQKNVGHEGYVERHHICPRALFKEYIDFRDHPWNCAKLTARQHFIAHWILARLYGNSMWYAFRMMCYCKRNYQERHITKSSRIYEEIKQNIDIADEIKEKLSLAGIKNRKNKSEKNV